MNFDELKNKWDKQKHDTLQIKQDLNSISSMNESLNKIKKEHRVGLIMRIISMVLLLIFPLLPYYHISGFVSIFYYFLIFYLIISTVYSCLRYYQFVRAINDYEVSSSFNHLTKVYYSYKYYRDTSLLAAIIDTPSGIGLLFILLAKEKTEDYFNKLITDSLELQLITKSIIVTILLTVIVVFTIVYWLYQNYDGKRLKAIKQVLEELEQ